MSRLTDLLKRTKNLDDKLGQELEQEFKTLSDRRAFGLNFERHKPEMIELPGQNIRKGDKVRILPPRGSIERPDDKIWFVQKIDKGKGKAHLTRQTNDNVEKKTISLDDVRVIADIHDTIYPGLVGTGKVEQGDNKPFHTVINGENFHALEALTFTHRHKIDAVYIDPPYNSGARDWKYNNHYVDEKDSYRHSKWLAMMERRLLVAKQLLNPEKSVLIVTIDEKEYLRLGLLLEQTFSGNRIQMISSIIAPQGQQRPNKFSRVEEYIYFVMFGSSCVLHGENPMIQTATSGKKDKEKPIWDSLKRRGTDANRKESPTLFYPIFVRDGNFLGTGRSLDLTTDRNSIEAPENAEVVWPLRDDGTEGRWQVGQERIIELFKLGFARIGKPRGNKPPAIMYLKSGEIRKLTTSMSAKISARSIWNLPSHNAGSYGSTLLRKLLPRRKFPFPKSLYAVEDTLRFFVADNPDAIILDFFAGSGTTAHAVMRLNRQNDGRRQSISITNNEVSDNEAKALTTQKLRLGDVDWEKLGICDYITKPRIKAAITGKTPEGNAIEGDYKFTDEFPIAEGFDENAEFFDLTYEAPLAINHNLAFERIAPLLWIRAGSRGRRIETEPTKGWDVADTYGLLTNLDKAKAFCEAISLNSDIRIAYIVTDDDRCFQSVTQDLPSDIEKIRLYESYLTNFQFAHGG